LLLNERHASGGYNIFGAAVLARSYPLVDQLHHFRIERKVHRRYPIDFEFHCATQSSFQNPHSPALALLLAKASAEPRHRRGRVADRGTSRVPPAKRETPAPGAARKSCGTRRRRVAGRLVVEHHLIGTGHAHEIIAAGGG